MEERILTFEASDDNGQLHTLHVYQEIISAGTHSNPGATIRGLKRIKTVEGYSVNRLAEGKYKVVQTGVSLRSSSPDAP